MKFKKENFYQSLDFICQLLYQKQYQGAEKELFNLTKKIFNSSYNGNVYQLKKLHQIIYRLFNNYYLSWLKKNKKTVNGLAQYHNFLLDKCRHQPEMDDLLYELEEYFAEKTEQRKKEVSYQLKCYQNNLH